MSRISNTCKEEMTTGFGFTDSELSQIEKFMDRQDGKTAKDILDDLIKDKRLNSKQKVIISYVVGNSVAHESMKASTKSAEIDMSYFGG